jgi:hypothetical protein
MDALSCTTLRAAGITTIRAAGITTRSVVQLSLPTDVFTLDSSLEAHPLSRPSADPMSFLGEIWFSESDTLSGPWLAAKKIVTHDNYSFYNPKQHPYFDQDGGRVIFFEGTYTNMFTDNKDPTPRYNYNQIMYRLDLSDLRLLMQRHSDR